MKIALALLTWAAVLAGAWVIGWRASSTRSVPERLVPFVVWTTLEARKCG